MKITLLSNFHPDPKTKRLRLSTIEDYTTLKLKPWNLAAVTGLSTIEDYTTLKPSLTLQDEKEGLSTIEDYTTLKR